MIILLTSSDHAAFFFQGGYIAMTTNALQSAIFTTFPPRCLRRDWELGTSAKPPLLLRAFPSSSSLRSSRSLAPRASSAFVHASLLRKGHAYFDNLQLPFIGKNKTKRITVDDYT